MRIAVIATHPDDEVLGAGGTLAGHVDRGDDVHAVVMAEGASSRYDPGMVDVLHKQGEQAAREIGFATWTFHRLPDQRLDTLPLIEVTQLVERVLEDLQPEVVYTHFAGDVNHDHRVVARAVWTACRPYRFPRIKDILAFETPSSTEWGFPSQAERFAPTRYVDVTATLERKLSAMACYASELRDYPHPRSLRALTERAAGWGAVVGRSLVEPFVVLRQVS